MFGDYIWGILNTALMGIIEAMIKSISEQIMWVYMCVCVAYIAICSTYVICNMYISFIYSMHILYISHIC